LSVSLPGFLHPRTEALCTPFEPTTVDRLALIETEINTQRAHYREALEAGHDGECEWYETVIDDLLAEWAAMSRAVKE